jgi:hypothetical protein
MNKLHDLHEKLTERLTTLMETGTDDPRVLKEVREFLRDNNINDTTIGEPMLDASQEAIILEDDYLINYKEANG